MAAQILKLLLCTYMAVTLKELFTTWIQVRGELNYTYKAHAFMYDQCNNMADLRNQGDFYCSMAYKAMNVGYYSFMAREVIDKTKWCGGYHCSSLTHMDALSKILLATVTVTIFRPSVMKKLWDVPALVRKKRIDRFITNEEKGATEVD